MNRFFRSALFPLVIIAALVWLALQTLGSHGPKVSKQTTSWVYQQVRDNPGSINEVKIDPGKQSLTLVDQAGKHYSVIPQAQRTNGKIKIARRASYTAAIATMRAE